MSPTLLAVTGLSPAIVTETVWALARETLRIIPGRVVFITTRTGEGKIRDQLFTPVPAFGGLTVWQALREALEAKEDELIAEPPRVIGSTDRRTGTLEPLEDIVTPAQNRIAAEYILEQVRGIVENPDTPLVASIAGGRKTMGALLHAAVTLLGRETDRLTHVLVSPPFETLPGFFFPGQPGGLLTDREGKPHNPADADIYLADLPFVPLRNRFQDLGTMPGGFAGLVRALTRGLEANARRPHLVELSYREKCVWIDGGPPRRVSVKALAVLHFLLASQEKGCPPADQPEAADDMTLWLRTADFIPLMHRPKSMDAGSIRHSLNALRTALKGSGWEIPRRTLMTPPFILRVRGLSAPERD